MKINKMKLLISKTNNFKFFSVVSNTPNVISSNILKEKLPKEVGDKFLNPVGFLNEEEVKAYFNESNDNSLKNQNENKDFESNEFGFKVKGLEPTRYGDWERKGRCFDF